MLPNAATLSSAPESLTLANYQIIRRAGAVVPFEPSRIAQTLLDAFAKVQGIIEAAWSDFVGCAYLSLLAEPCTFHNAMTENPPSPKSKASASTLGHMGFFSASKLNMRNAP